MTKQEMLNRINGLKAEAIELAKAGKLTEAKAKKAELDEAQAAFDLLNELGDRTVPETAKPAAQPEDSELAKFCNAARRGFRNAYTGMQEGTDADGGYTVPKDIETRVRRYKEAKDKLEDLVSVETPKAPSGARTYLTKKQHAGFLTVAETAKIGKEDGPKFERVEFAVEKRASILPVSQELISDSDERIAQLVSDWLGEEDIATVNKLVLDKVATVSKTDLKGLDGIKEAANKTLGAAYAGAVSIVTNDDGLQYLDTLKDKNGRYILAPDAQDPVRKVISTGSGVLPVHVVSCATLASDGKKVPFIVADMKSAITLFRYGTFKVTSTDVGTVGDLSAFENDLMLFKGSTRLDCKVVDKGAIVNGFIDTTAPAVGA